MTIDTVTPITATTPNRATQTRSVFNGAMSDTFGGQKTLSEELAVSVPQMNVDIAQANSDAASAALSEVNAAAQANFKGPWSAQTGAAAIPYSVSDAGVDYRLIAALADVTTVQPAVTGGWATYWEEISIGLKDTETLTPAVAAELSSSVLVSLVAPSVLGVAMTMPTATSWDDGSLVKIVKNNGVYPFMLASKDGGSILAKVLPQHTISIYLATSLDADGKYVVMDTPPSVTRGDEVQFEAGNVTNLSGCQIGPNKFLLTYADTGNSSYFTGVVCTEADGILTAGTPVVIESAAVQGRSGVSATDIDDEAVTVHIAAGVMDFNYLTISGTVLTVASTESSIYTSNHASDGCEIEYSSADKFVVRGTNVNPDAYCFVLLTSGTAYSSKGTAVAGGTGGYANAFNMKKMVTDVFACAYRDNTALGYTRIMTLTGSVVSFGTAVSHGATQGTGMNRVARTSDSTWAIASNLNAATLITTVISFLSYSGTTVTFEGQDIVDVGSINTSSFSEIAAFGEGIVAMMSNISTTYGNQKLRLYSQVPVTGEFELISEKQIPNPHFMTNPPNGAAAHAMLGMGFGKAIYIHYGLSGKGGRMTLINGDFTA